MRPCSITLPDGRRLGFATYGDPRAAPVLYCHGWPGSRLEAALLPDPPGWLVAPDRPGYGLSDAPHQGAMLDWGQDVSALADHLGIAHFAVAGVSAGGPFALALAHALPARVSAVALANAVPPHAASGAVRHLFRLGRRPWLRTPLLHLGRRLVRSRIADQAWRLARFLPDDDRTALTPPIAAMLLASWREGLRPGIAGTARDAALLAAPWGFSIAELRMPVALWHGAADTIVPPAALAEFRALPDAHVTVVPDAGHYALPLRHGRAMLEALLRLAAA